MHFAFDAEAVSGLWDRYAWSQMQQWHLNPHTATFREMWFHGDWSHAWGGSPLIQMSSRILGVTSAEPGYASVRIAPHLADLGWAKGVVPTPRGDVKVSWKHGDTGFTIDFSSPEGVPILLDLSAIPALDHPTTINGEAGQAQRDGTFNLAPGKHTVVLHS